MKVAQFVTASYAYPTPKEVVFAPLNVGHILAEGLKKEGVDVTWYAPLGTKTSAKLKTFGIKPSKLDPKWKRLNDRLKNDINFLFDTFFLSQVSKEAENYDIVHNHSFFFALSFARLAPTVPFVFTLHDPLSAAHIQANLNLNRHLKNVFFISISDNQRRPMPSLNYAATIYHGLELKKISWSPKPGRRWLFVGRIVPEKGAHIAARLVKEIGGELDIIGPLSSNLEKQRYFKKEIEPYLDGKKIRFLGPKPYQETLDYFKKAKGFLFPLQWEEPFGLTMAESLATGTPVVAFNRGSVPELISDQKTGFIVKSEREMLKAMAYIDKINRNLCRQTAEDRFSAQRMINDHIKTYERIVGRFKKETLKDGKIIHSNHGWRIRDKALADV